MRGPAINDQGVLTAALSRLEAWFETMRSDGGYTGPSIGRRQYAALFCGPGFDWRYEGLLDGLIARYATTHGAAYLKRMEWAVNCIAAAQLRIGCFRNSHFDANPCEGGMPHEPAMLAAACRARKVLAEAGSPAVAVLDTTLERYVEEYLLKRLWSKQLLTFKDWEITDFTVYTPDSVAAVIELLLAYGEISGQQARLEPYVAQAGQSLLKAQANGSVLDGGIFPASNIRDAISPYRAARCLPALAQMAERNDDGVYMKAAERLATFVETYFEHSVVYANRPHARVPMLYGALAGTALLLHRSDFSQKEPRERALHMLLQHQQSTGAFENAAGFGGQSSPQRPDWRSIMPVCGWQDKIFALLASVCDRPSESAVPAPCEREVKVRGRNATYREDDESMCITTRSGQVLFAWKKKTVWPTTCLL